MGARILHYGVDEHFRLRTLRNAGYVVQNCHSLNEFHWILRSGDSFDAVAFTESLRKAPRAALSVARARRCPLVLFQDWTPRYDESEFDLVVPMLTAPGQWLGDIASLIGNTRPLVRSSKDLRTKPQFLPDQGAAAGERTRPESRPAGMERERNHELALPSHGVEVVPSAIDKITEASSFLRLLDIDAMRGFQSLVRTVSYPEGTVLFNQGQPAREIHLVLTGNVKLSVDASDGRRFILQIAKPGELLGLAAAFGFCPYQATCVTCFACDIGLLRSSDFLNFLEAHPGAFRAAARELALTYNQTCARLQTMGVNLTVTAKVAALILEWLDSENTNRKCVQIRMTLTHEEIGQCIGTTRESVTRVLHDLQHRQIIVHKGSMLRIVDRAALEIFAGKR